MRRKVVIVDHREEGYDLEKKTFASEDLELEFFNCKDEHELIEVVRDAYVIIFTSSRFSPGVINQLTNCKMLIRYGTGLDNVDINAATKKGIYVCNTPNYGTFSVAEHAFGLLISLVRKLIVLDNNVRNNIWSLDAVSPVTSLRYKTFGIFGFGNIGRHLSKMALAFEMNVIICDPYVADGILSDFQVKRTTFDDLVTNSDHISIHAPLNSETRHLFNKSVFNSMKSSATIINTSRGDLINQQDLIFALKSGRISGAGLDVFENEPPAVDSELLTMKNVILTPHAAWYTEESVVNLHHEVIDDVVRVIRGDKPINSVNIKV